MLDDIKTYLKNANIVDRLIILLLVVFVMTIWMNHQQLSWLILSSDVSEMLQKPWTLVSYILIHQSFISLVANAILLYYFGHLFIDYFTIKQLLLYLISGVLVGGVAYELYNLFSPSQTVYLSGFDVAIATMIAGLVAKLPYYNLNLRFIGNVKLWVIFILWLGLNCIGVLGINVGIIIALLSASVFGSLLTAILKEGLPLIDLIKLKDNRHI